MSISSTLRGISPSCRLIGNRALGAESGGHRLLRPEQKCVFPHQLSGTLIRLSPLTMSKGLPSIKKLPDELLLRVFKLTKTDSFFIWK